MKHCESLVISYGQEASILLQQRIKTGHKMYYSIIGTSTNSY